MMDEDWPSLLARTGLEATFEQFPDDVREALALAQGWVEKTKAQHHFSDEPAHIFQAARGGAER